MQKRVWCLSLEELKEILRLPYRLWWLNTRAGTPEPYKSRTVGISLVRNLKCLRPGSKKISSTD